MDNIISFTYSDKEDIIENIERKIDCNVKNYSLRTIENTFCHPY